MKRLHIRDRVLTSHVACTSGTSRVLTVASLQRLMMEALVPAPADCEVRSMTKFLNAQIIATIKIHRQQCQVYDHTRTTVNRSPGRCLIIIHPDHGQEVGPVISILSYTSGNSCPFSISVFRMTEVEMSVTVVPIPDCRVLRHSIQKLVPRYDGLNSEGEYVEK